MTAMQLPPGFRQVRPEDQTRLVVGIWGGTKEGKTSLALSFPKPLFLFNFNYGYEAALRLYPNDVYAADYLLDEDTTPERYASVLGDFFRAFRPAVDLAQQHKGTIVIDTATELWQVIQNVDLEQVRQKRFADDQAKGNRAKFTSLDDVRLYPYDYARANLHMGGLIRRILDRKDVNAVFINKSKGIYDDQGRDTGQIAPQWWGETGSTVQSVMQVFIQSTLPPFSKPDAKPVPTLHARVDIARFNKAAEGMVVQNPTYDLLKPMLLGVS